MPSLKMPSDCFIGDMIPRTERQSYSFQLCHIAFDYAGGLKEKKINLVAFNTQLIRWTERLCDGPCTVPSRVTELSH